MNVRAKCSLLLIGLWLLCGVRAGSLRRTMADIQDALLSPSSQRYSVYVLPPATHADSLRKRQADYEADDAREAFQGRPEGRRDAPGPGTPPFGFLEVSQGPGQFGGAVREGAPFFITDFDPELQPGWGHEEELEDKMDSYAVDPTPGSSSLTISGDGLKDEAQDSPKHSDADKDAKVLKKLLDKPKKLMKVIKAKGNGNYVPEEVPGVMLPTEDGEEAFVPENLLEDTELLLTAGSAQQPTYVSPESPATPAPMGGMPYDFGWVVDDEATANFQTRQEKGDKNGVVTGCYQVLDPNGLVRTVTYRADKGGFRVLSMTRGPDKTPCPGLEEGNRIQIPTSSNPRPRPSFPANSGGFSNNFANNFSKSTSSSSSFQSSSSSNYSSSSQESSSFNGFNANNFNVNNVYEQPPASTYAPPTSRPTYAPPPPPPSPTAAPPDYYNLQGSAQQAWMAEYLQNITQQLYSSFTNSSTQTNSIYGAGGNSGFVNFPFVLIPIATFLDLKKSGAISGDVQSYGAFVQPSTGQLQLSQYLQQLEQQRQQQQQQEQQQRAYNKTVQHTTTNTYNTTQTNTKQLKHQVQGVDTVNYQISGERGRPGSQRIQQQVQRQQHSSQSENKNHSASSSSSSSFQSSLGANQGYLPPTNQHPVQGQYQQRQQSSQQSSQSSKSSSSSEKSSASSFHSNLGGAQRQYQNYQQQSAQSAKAHDSSSSSSSSSFQSNFGGGQGYSPSQQAVQHRAQQSSQSSKKSSSSSSSSSFQSNFGSLQGYLPPSNPANPSTSYGLPVAPGPSTARPYQPRPTTPVPSTARPYQPRPTTPRPTTARPYRPAPTTPRPYQPAPTTPRPYQPAPTTRPYQPTPTTPRPYQPTTPRPIPSSPRPSQSYNLPSFGSGASASYSSQKSQSSQQSQASQASQSSSSSSNYGNGQASQSFQSQSSSSKKSDSSKKSQSSSNFSYSSGNNRGAAQQSSLSSASSSSSSSESSSSSFKQNSFSGFNGAGAAGGSGLSFPGFVSSPSPPNYVPPSVPVTVGPQYGTPSPDVPDYDEPEPSYIDGVDSSDSGFSVPAAEPQFDMDGWIPIANDYSPPSDPQSFGPPTPEPSPNLAFPGVARGGTKNFSYSSSQSSSSENKSSSQQSQQFSSSFSGVGPQQGFTQQQNQQLPDWVAQQYGG
ncbi:serine-rich adhesin for platelets-like isoform X1 [Penaeus monodon]|uniref:serine-rich adhesin for platelets-like isoform X1 n=1 Tax=Penaeus monodon TaxID=6687 RepID=UPI0018A77F6F|nr:serine-rich adhesin for platelets-like isoform X1 [Penaeus monodon]